MSVQVSVDIDAPVERVWANLIDVEAWPRTTASITSVQRLDGGPFHVGSRARVKQPKLPALVWEVTDFQPLRSFTWETRSPGATTIGIHSVTPKSDSGVTVTLEVHRRGPLAPLVNALTDKLTREYVTMEAQGMQRVSEVEPAVSRG